MKLLMQDNTPLNYEQVSTTYLVDNLVYLTVKGDKYTITPRHGGSRFEFPANGNKKEWEKIGEAIRNAAVLGESLAE